VIGAGTMVRAGRVGRACRIAALITAAALAATLEGCGENPVLPRPEEAVVSGPPLLVVQPDGSSGYEQAGALTVDTNPEPTSRALKVSQEVNGTKGGWMRCGRFLLAISAGAFDTVGTITMTMPDTTLMFVDLTITPSRLNGFHAPVYLVANTTGTDVPCDSLSIYWNDPKSASWTDVTTEKNVTSAMDCMTQLDSGQSGNSGPGSYDTNSTSYGITSVLPHFSRYAAGKAGW